MGLAIFVGAFVIITSLPLIAIMSVGDVYGASQVRIQFDKYNRMNARRSCSAPGYEVVLLYIAVLLSFICKGGDL